MGFVSLATIIIIGILLGAILINFLRSVMFITLAVLGIGIAYYLFLATPEQKVKMDLYAKNFSQMIYKIDDKQLNNIINNAKKSISKIQKTAKEKIEELKK